MEVIELANKIKNLNTNDRMYLLEEIFKDESVSATELLVAKIANLEKFKMDAKRDIVKIAEAGMELGEKEMRSVTKIGGRTRKKSNTFKLAMVRCLIEAGAHRGTEYGEEIAAADFSAIDEEWYEWGWKPKTTKYNLTLKEGK
jgi:hypothetical protein